VTGQRRQERSPSRVGLVPGGYRGAFMAEQRRPLVRSSLPWTHGGLGGGSETPVGNSDGCPPPTSLVVPFGSYPRTATSAPIPCRNPDDPLQIIACRGRHHPRPRRTRKCRRRPASTGVTTRALVKGACSPTTVPTREVLTQSHCLLYARFESDGNWSAEALEPATAALMDRKGRGSSSRRIFETVAGRRDVR
jgi:hypothetical protein